MGSNNPERTLFNRVNFNSINLELDQAIHGIEECDRA